MEVQKDEQINICGHCGKRIIYDMNKHVMRVHGVDCSKRKGVGHMTAAIHYGGGIVRVMKDRKKRCKD